jgi:hypothetical protein
VVSDIATRLARRHAQILLRPATLTVRQRLESASHAECKAGRQPGKGRGVAFPKARADPEACQMRAAAAGVAGTQAEAQSLAA